MAFEVRLKYENNFFEQTEVIEERKRRFQKVLERTV